MVNDNQPDANPPARKKDKGTCKVVDDGDIVCGLTIYAKGYCKKHYSKQYKQQPKGTCKEVGFDGNICGLAAISNIGCCSKHYDKSYCTHMITLKPPFGNGKEQTRCTQRAIKGGLCRDHGAPRVTCSVEGCQKMGRHAFNSTKLCKQHFNDARTDEGTAMIRLKKVCNITVPAGRLGLHVKVQEYGLGVEITGVKSDSPIIDKVMVGDIIMRIDDTDVVNMESLRTINNERERNFLIFRTTKNDGSGEIREEGMKVNRSSMMTPTSHGGSPSTTTGTFLSPQFMTFVESLWATENEAQESTFNEGDEVIAKTNNEPPTTEEMTDEKEESVVADVGRVDYELKDAQTQKSADDEAAQESTVNEEDEVIAEVNNGPSTTEKTADEKEGGGIKNKTRKKIEEMKRKINTDYKDKIEVVDIGNDKLKRLLGKGKLGDGEIDAYTEFLRRRDETREKTSQFYNVGFVKLDVSKGPQLKETRQIKKNKRIFDMKYLFIPINVGSHYTCVVVYMEDKRICYYDSYKSTKTRLGVNAGKEKRMSILTIVLEYLKTKYSEIKGVALPGEWKLEPTCSEIQQANTKDCGVFVCMYMDFIHDGCEVNFDPDEFTSEDMRK